MAMGANPVFAAQASRTVRLAHGRRTPGFIHSIPSIPFLPSFLLLPSFLPYLFILVIVRPCALALPLSVAGAVRILCNSISIPRSGTAAAAQAALHALAGAEVSRRTLRAFAPCTGADRRLEMGFPECSHCSLRVIHGKAGVATTWEGLVRLAMDKAARERGASAHDSTTSCWGETTVDRGLGRRFDARFNGTTRCPRSISLLPNSSSGCG